MKEYEENFIKKYCELQERVKYEEEFIREYSELQERVQKLGSMLSKYLADELDFTPTCSYNMLHEQYCYMTHYLNALKRRAKLECIDID